MIEAIGRQFLSSYFAIVNQVLKQEGGIGVFLVTTMPETRYERYFREMDFIQKWIFPGSHCPSVTTLINSVYEGSNGTPIVHEIQNIGGHFPRTLAQWRTNFLESFETEIRPAVVNHYEKTLSDEQMAVFKCKFEFDFSYCQVGFEEKILGDVVLTLSWEGRTALLY